MKHDEEPHGDHDRPELSVAEAHHRIKNTLQNVISYINIMFMKKDVVTRDELEKLVRFIKSLASLHDFLRDSSVRRDESGLVRLDILMNDLVELHAVNLEIDAERFPPIQCTARRAATTSLIMTELFDNASRFGTGAASLKVIEHLPGSIRFSTSNAIPAHRVQSKSASSYGLNLVKNLAKVDFGIEPTIETEDDCFRVTLSVPVQDPPQVAVEQTA